MGGNKRGFLLTCNSKLYYLHSVPTESAVWGLKGFGKKVVRYKQSIWRIIMQTPLPEEQAQTSASSSTESAQSVTRRNIISLVCVILLISFFLPWANFFGANLSGLDIQKNFSSFKLVWVLPTMALIAFIANIAGSRTSLFHRLAGAVPFIIFLYSLGKFSNDLWEMLLPSAWLALVSGAILLCGSNQIKK
jgi:hypothetical protein